VSLNSTVLQPQARLAPEGLAPGRPVREGPVREGDGDAPALELLRLRDGSSVTVRAAGAADEPALLAFLSGLGLEAKRMRFFTGAADMAYAAHLAAATGADRYGLIAHDEAGVMVGHATYAQLDRTRAEVAVEVADHLHGRGLGTILIERLARVAEQHGITNFVAEVLCENRAMLDVFREGFDGRVVHREGPEERVEFPTSAWRLAHERFARDPAPRNAVS
jgi:GNAT superfamily N-acetyltransferase